MNHRIACPLLAALLLAAPATAARPELRMASGTFRPDAPGAPPAWFHGKSIATSPRGHRYLVALTRGPLAPEERARLEADGATILDYVPVNGYRLRLAPEAEAAVRREAFVSWLGPIPAHLKAAPALGAGGSDDRVRVVLAVGEPPSRAVDALSGTDWSGAPAGKDGGWRLTATIPASRAAEVLSALASLPEVEAIELASRFRVSNQDAVWVHQSFVGPSPQQTPVFDRGIYGCGQVLAFADTAQDYDSCFFRDAVNGAPPVATCAAPPCPASAVATNRRKDLLYYNWSGGPLGEEDTCPSTITGTSGHGTHVSGSLAGDTSPYADCAGHTSPNRNGGDGLAPGAKLVVQEMGDGLEYLNDLGGTLWNLTDVAYQNGARIHSDSWSSACEDPLGNCIPGCTIPYDSFSRDADLAMWSHPDLLIVAAAGNSGQVCPAPIALGSPANAKSPISVGSVGHGTNASIPSSFSSPGPVHDGRLAPTLSAQGEATVSAASDANLASNNCSTCSLDGTSMSTPTAAGLAALVREYYQTGYYATGARNEAQGFAPTAALVKATLIDGAVPLGSAAPGPDFQSGYGRIELDRTLAFAGGSFQLRVDDRREGVGTGGVVVHAYDVSAGTPFRATLAWSDYPAALGAATARVNELKLEVVDPAGHVWFQKIDPVSGLPVPTSNAADPHDGLNVVERLVFDPPAPGRWIVRVRGVSVPWGPQPFALVVRGAIADCSAPAAPPAPALSSPAGHQVLVSWTAVPGAAAYNVYRSFGPCPGGPWTPVATAVPGTSFLDTGVSGGTTYSYVVTATSDGGGACESPRSACASIVPAGDCFLAPSFRGVKTAASAGAASCSVTLTWDPAAPYCGADVRYNVYRGSGPGFTPGPANRIARCVIGTTFTDGVNLSYGVSQWYVVRAEDASTGHGGPCRGGNEDSNTASLAGFPDGPPTTGTWRDDAGDTGVAKFAAASPWTDSSTGGDSGPKVYVGSSYAGACADLTSPTITLADPSQGPTLSFATEHALDYDPTGELFGREGSLGQVEIATGPAFSNWTRVPLSPDYPAPMDFPYNVCPTTQNPVTYFSGTQSTYATYTASLGNWAGGDVKIRFHLSGDFIYSNGTWSVDDVAVTKAIVPGTCTSAAAGPPPIPDGTIVLGTPMTASRSGSNVVVNWDASQCTAAAVNVYRGAVGSYGSFNGGSCNLPPTGSATVAMPDNSWFLVAGTDGVSTDGSWARNADGSERSYGGAPAACPGITQHVTNNACP